LIALHTLRTSRPRRSSCSRSSLRAGCTGRSCVALRTLRTRRTSWSRRACCTGRTIDTVRSRCAGITLVALRTLSTSCTLRSRRACCTGRTIDAVRSIRSGRTSWTDVTGIAFVALRTLRTGCSRRTSCTGRSRRTINSIRTVRSRVALRTLWSGWTSRTDCAIGAVHSGVALRTSWSRRSVVALHAAITSRTLRAGITLVAFRSLRSFGAIQVSVHAVVPSLNRGKIFRDRCHHWRGLVEIEKLFEIVCHSGRRLRSEFHRAAGSVDCQHSLPERVRTDRVQAIEIERRDRFEPIGPVITSVRTCRTP